MKNILKRIGSNIEICGTPDKTFWNALNILFILSFCFRCFKNEFRKVTHVKTQSVSMVFSNEEVVWNTVKCILRDAKCFLDKLKQISRHPRKHLLNRLFMLIIV